jgi:uncharacterized membrane protein YhaH (DUF805 family)
MQDYLEQYRIVVFDKYAQFSGRAGRKEFWMFFLVNVIIGVLLGLTRIQALGTIYSILVFIPGLAVAIRRLHDTNRSGWFLLLGFIPVVGQIILIVFLAQKSSGVSTS